MYPKYQQLCALLICLSRMHLFEGHFKYVALF